MFEQRAKMPSLNLIPDLNPKKNVFFEFERIRYDEAVVLCIERAVSVPIPLGTHDPVMQTLEYIDMASTRRSEMGIPLYDGSEDTFRERGRIGTAPHHVDAIGTGLAYKGVLVLHLTRYSSTSTSYVPRIMVMWDPFRIDEMVATSEYSKEEHLLKMNAMQERFMHNIKAQFE